MLEQNQVEQEQLQKKIESELEAKSRMNTVTLIVSAILIVLSFFGGGYVGFEKLDFLK